MARFKAMPYAKALHAVILEESPQAVEETLELLDRVATALRLVPDFEKVLITPMVPVETKTAILDEILDKLQISGPTRRFIHVVQRQYRMQYLPNIRDCYRGLVDRSLGRVRAKIEVPSKLSKGDQQKVMDVIATVVGSSVIAEYVENPELLAGFRVQVGSKVFDGSLVGQLEQLRRRTHFEQG